MPWSEYERQLFAAAISDASYYEQIVVAIRTATNQLRVITSLEQLNAAWSRGVELPESALPEAARRIPREQLLGAAFTLREREIREEVARQQSAKRIDEARSSGREWVTLEETGDLSSSGPSSPYSSLEMHLSSGLALVSMVRADLGRAGAVFALTVVKLDRATGELMDAEPGVEDWKEFSEREDFMAQRITLRDRIGTTEWASVP